MNLGNEVIKEVLDTVWKRSIVKKCYGKDTGLLAVTFERVGRRGPIPLSTQEKIVSGVIRNVVIGPWAQAVTEKWDIPYATIQKILKKVIKCYSHKISCYQKLFTGDWVDFALTLLARMKVDDGFLWIILWGK